MCDKKYFSNLTLVQSNVNTISCHVDLIRGSGRATIILISGTQFQITHVLYSNASNRNLLSFKDIHRNRYHDKTMNHDGVEYLLITNIISGKKTNIGTTDFFIMWIILDNYYTY